MFWQANYPKYITFFLLNKPACCIVISIRSGLAQMPGKTRNRVATMKTFYVTSEEPCTVCNKDGEISNPDHEQQLAFQEKWNRENPQPEGDDTAVWQAFNRRQDDALWEYLGDEGYEHVGPAPFITCEHCNGKRIVTARVSLQEALAELAKIQ
jgi:hypothetical protein